MNGLRIFTAVFLLFCHHNIFAAKYYITGTNYTRFNGMVQAGSTDNGVLYLRVTLSSINGGNVPVTINDITFDHTNTSQVNDISNVKLWYSGSSLFFTSATQIQSINGPIGNSVSFNNLNFNLNATGSHYFWYTCSVNSTAKAGNVIYGGLLSNSIKATDYIGGNFYSPSNFNPTNHLEIICPTASYTPPSTPALPLLSQFTQPSIAGGANYNSLLRKSDGTVWVAGYNNSGQFGDGTVSWTYTNNLWQQVTDANIFNIVQIDVGWETNLALRSDGTVWGWGDNWWGKVGNGVASADEPTPQQVIKQNGSPLTNVVKVMTGMFMSVALTNDHHVYAWGKNSGGAMGSAYTANLTYSRAQLLYDGPNPINWAIDVEIGESIITILRYDGTVWCMGTNTWGTLGNGSNISSSVPVCVVPPSGLCGEALSNIISISSDHRSTLALDASGNVYGWGWNNYAQSGNNNPGVIQRIAFATLGTSCTGALTNIIQIEQSHNNGFAIDANNNLYSWGSDQSGQLGNGGAPIGANVYCPVFVTNNAVESAAGLSNMFYWNTNGDLCAAGFNWYGQLGIGGPYGCCNYVHTPVCNSFGPLPVELLHFSGHSKNKNNLIQWSTATELNNDYFLIEYSEDAYNFTTLDKINGAGNSNHLLNYAYIHHDIEQEVLYYRLKQIDYNGDYFYSNIISVKNKDAININSVWVSTTDEYVRIHFPGTESERIHLEIMDMTGSLILQESYFFVEDKKCIKLPKQYFLNGIFILNVQSTTINYLPVKFMVY